MALEKIVDTYWEILQKTESPDRKLAQFYGVVFDVRPTESLRMILGRFVKIYGREEVFATILKIAGMEKFNPKGNITGLLTHILARNALRSDAGLRYSPDLSEKVKEIDEQVKKVREENSS